MLVVQWLRTHLGMQGTQVQPPDQEARIPHVSEQLSRCPVTEESHDAMEIPGGTTKTRGNQTH